MTRRYIAVPRGWIEPSFANEGIALRTDTMTVFQDDRTSRKTGLLDQYGNDLYAVERMEMVGFMRGWQRIDGPAW